MKEETAAGAGEEEEGERIEKRWQTLDSDAGLRARLHSLLLAARDLDIVGTVAEVAGPTGGRVHGWDKTRRTTGKHVPDYISSDRRQHKRRTHMDSKSAGL